MSTAPDMPRPPRHSAWLRSHLGLVVAVTTLLSSLVTVATWMGWTPFIA